MQQRSISDYFGAGKRIQKQSSKSATESDVNSSLGSTSGTHDETGTTNYKPSQSDTPAAGPTVENRETSKRHRDSPESAPKRTKRLDSADRVQPLASFACGNPADPQFLASEEHQERHEAFARSVGGTGNRKRTPHARVVKPYEQQYIELKRRYMDSILIVQNGYKYQIYGNDAYTAGRALGRSAIAGWRELDEGVCPTDALYDRFASVTFPLESLSFNVEKLVAHGCKVAVANQVETAALRGSARGPFERQVQHIYTKGTLVEELTSASRVSGHVLAVCQRGKRFGIVAAQVATGDVVCDEFDDSAVAMELETRLLHIQPSEVLIVGYLPASAAKLVESLQATRVVSVPEPAESAIQMAVDAYPEALKCLGKDATAYISAFTALATYLREFDVDRVLALPNNMQSFSLRSHMYLSGDTLNSLEIFANQTDGQLRGSLLWVVDATVTQFGHRLMRKWLAKPLLDRGMIHERVEAVSEIIEAKSDLWNRLRDVMNRMPDLERYALQIYHRRINPRQLYWAVYAFQQAATAVTEPQIRAAGLKSPLLQQLLLKITQTRGVVEGLMGRINVEKARQGCEPREFFIENIEDEALSLLADYEHEIGRLDGEFRAHVRDQAVELGIPLREVSVPNEHFVLGCSKRDATHIPADWRRINTTTSEVRLRSPRGTALLKEYQPLIERRAAAAQHAFDLFVAEIADKHFGPLRDAVATLSHVDCLLALASTSSKHGWMCPDIVDFKCLEIIDGRHPMIEELMLDSYIPNSTRMYESESRTMIVTGPNMGGKSSFVRQVALIVILAQIGCYVPAAKARLSLVDAVYTRMGAFDNMLRGESTFMVELRECSAILQRATSRSLVLLDEIGRGTSTLDGVAIAYAVLRAMIEDNRSFTLFITHYPLLASLGTANDAPAREVTNWSMDCVEQDGQVTFLYKLVARVAHQSYGVNVARMAGLPAEIVTAAEQKAAEMEQRLVVARSALGSLLLRALAGDGGATTELANIVGSQ